MDFTQVAGAAGHREHVCGTQQDSGPDGHSRLVPDTEPPEQSPWVPDETHVGSRFDANSCTARRLRAGTEGAHPEDPTRGDGGEGPPYQPREHHFPRPRLTAQERLSPCELPQNPELRGNGGQCPNPREELCSGLLHTAPSS